MTKDEDTWIVDLSRKAGRQVEDLRKEHPKIYDQAMTLVKDIAVNGPWRSDWTNFGPLKGGFPKDTFHCHIKSGKPTYVVCWSIKDKKVKITEVFYVGTHEKAPY